jgi:hypothetical protein
MLHTQAQSHIKKAATAAPSQPAQRPTPEAQTRKQCGEHPSDDRSEHKARGVARLYSTSKHASWGGSSSVRMTPMPPTAPTSAYQRDPPTSQMRLAECWSPIPADAENGVQAVVLVSIDLRSQHGRLVSARVITSVRKGVLGSCNMAASQVAGRAYRIVLQRSRPRRGGERGLERPPKVETF